jgi:hypothetical protein
MCFLYLSDLAIDKPFEVRAITHLVLVQKSEHSRPLTSRCDWKKMWPRKLKRWDGFVCSPSFLKINHTMELCMYLRILTGRPMTGKLSRIHCFKTKVKSI